MVWQQVYNPLDNMWLSTLLAAVPVVVMLVGLGFMHLKAHIAAAAGLVAALAVAVFVYGMPVGMAGNAALLGALIAALSPNTRLAVAAGLTLPGEWVKSALVRDWRALRAQPWPALELPAVFLFGR